MSTPGAGSERLTLLRTKRQQPQVRADWVRRSRLVKHLNQNPDRKLTLGSAPAWYGKTTLLSDWIARSRMRAAWLSLEASDNNLARFLTYVIAAIQTVHEGADAGPGRRRPCLS